MAGYLLLPDTPRPPASQPARLPPSTPAPPYLLYLQEVEPWDKRQADRKQQIL